MASSRSSTSGATPVTSKDEALSAADTGNPEVAEQLQDTPVQQSMANDGAPIVTFEGPGAEVTVASPPEGAAVDASGRRKCVVNNGEGMHVGSATPGSVICSYHAMHYNTDGTPRTDNIPDDSRYVGE